jgi:hypothetical protein
MKYKVNEGFSIKCKAGVITGGAFIKEKWVDKMILNNYIKNGIISEVKEKI